MFPSYFPSLQCLGVLDVNGQSLHEKSKFLDGILHYAIDLRVLRRMTRRESVEGINGRLSITLDQESFAPGEVVRGVVELCMLETVESREPLAVVIQGREAVAWDEGDYSPVTNAFDKIFLQDKIELTPSVFYDVGKWEHRFELLLPTDLPSSFELLNVYNRTVDRLRIEIKYQASVWLRLNDDLVAYLNAEQEFTVHAPPTITPPVRALEISESQVVHWLCCIKRGNLQLTVEAPKDVYPSGEVVPLRCRVDGSSCKTSIKSISVELTEELMLRNLGERPNWIVTRVLSTQQVDGQRAGNTSDQVMNVGLVENKKEEPANPDVIAHFFRCTHRLVVRCKPFAAQDVVCEVPVRVLHHHSSFSAGAVRVLRMPAEATCGSKSP